MTQKSLLSRAWEACKAAVPVWVVLSFVAEIKGRTRFSIKRSTIGRLCGIKRMATISRALTALHNLDVLRREVKHCRRPDGTLFHRLIIRIKHRISKSVRGEHRVAKSALHRGAKSVPSYENQIAESVPQCPDQVSKSATNHRVAKSAPESEKRYTSFQDAAAPAGAAGPRRSADAARLSPAGAAGPVSATNVWSQLSRELKLEAQRVATKVGCKLDDFRCDHSDLNWIDLGDCDQPGDAWITIHSFGKTSFLRLDAKGEEGVEEKWTASTEQIEAIKKSLAQLKANESRVLPTPSVSSGPGEDPQD